MLVQYEAANTLRIPKQFLHRSLKFLLQLPLLFSTLIKFEFFDMVDLLGINFHFQLISLLESTILLSPLR